MDRIIHFDYNPESSGGGSIAQDIYTTLNNKKLSITNALSQEGYSLYIKDEYPEESGTMICIFQANTEKDRIRSDNIGQIINKDNRKFYDDSSDIKSREYYRKSAQNDPE